MKDFIMQNWVSAVLVTGLLGYAGYLAITKQWAKLRELAYALMLQAERAYQESEGAKKFELVLQKLYTAMPAWMGVFITQALIRQKLQEWYEAAKDYLKA